MSNKESAEELHKQLLENSIKEMYSHLLQIIFEMQSSRYVTDK